MKHILTFIKKTLSRFFDHKPSFRFVYVYERPNIIKDYTVYLEGDKDEPWAALFICPCGCKEVIQLNLMEGVSPKWEVSINRDKITLIPSIWRLKGCRSHFFLKSGLIRWCK